MKKQLILSGLLLAALAISGCSLGSKDQPAGPTGQTPKKMAGQETAPSDQEDGNFFGSLSDLMKKGKAYKCTATFEDKEMKTSAVYYIDSNGKRTRIETKMEGADEKAKDMMGDSIMLTLDDTFYMWQTGTKMGTKMTITEEEKKEAEEAVKDAPEVKVETENDPGARYMDTETKFDCDPWRVDESVFQVPTDVTFTDMAEQMEGLVNMGEEMQKNMGGMMEKLQGQQ